MFRYIYILCLFISPIISTSGLSQEPISKSKQNLWLEKFEAGKPKISPAICPLYNPDLGLNLTGGLIVSFKTKQNNPYLAHSYAPIILAYDFQDNFISKASVNTFWFDNLLRFDCELAYQHLSDNYFGIGIQQIENVEKSGFPSVYKKNLYKLIPSILVQTIPGLYVGMGFNIGEAKASDLNDIMLEDLIILKQGTNLLSIGAGLRINYTMLSKSKKTGMAFQSAYDMFHPAMGSDLEYSKLQVAYQLNIAMQGKRVLFFKATTENNFGNIPWTDMAFLGYDNLVTGILHEKYRDKSLVYSSIDVEQQLPELATINLNKHSLLFGFGGGAIYGTEPGKSKPLFQFKFGYQYTCQPGFKLSLNFGITEESAGIYLNFYRSLL